MITGILEARGRLDARDRKVRLHDAYLAAHPGKDGKALLKLMKALERASHPPLTLEEQASEQVAAAMKHLMGTP